MKKERKKRECGRKRQTQLTIHDCSNKTCPASSPPVPLVVMEGLPRLLLSSLEPVESPPPTLLWGLARSCISIDLRGREEVDGENEGGGRERVGENETAVISEWGPERRTCTPTAGNPPPLRVVVLGGPQRTRPVKDRVRGHSLKHMWAHAVMSGLLVPASDSQRVFAGTGHYLPACCLFKREHSVCLCSSGLQYKPMACQRASVLQCVSNAWLGRKST